jgi:hypothetical protein
MLVPDDDDVLEADGSNRGCVCGSSTNVDAWPAGYICTLVARDIALTLLTPPPF